MLVTAHLRTMITFPLIPLNFNEVVHVITFVANIVLVLKIHHGLVSILTMFHLMKSEKVL